MILKPLKPGPLWLTELKGVSEKKSETVFLFRGEGISCQMSFCVWTLCKMVPAPWHTVMNYKHLASYIIAFIGIGVSMATIPVETSVNEERDRAVWTGGVLLCRYYQKIQVRGLFHNLSLICHSVNTNVFEFNAWQTNHRCETHPWAMPDGGEMFLNARITLLSSLYLTDNYLFDKYCKTGNIRGHKILRFLYFELFVGGNLCGFLKHSKIWLVDGNSFQDDEFAFWAQLQNSRKFLPCKNFMFYSIPNRSRIPKNRFRNQEE